MAQMPTFKSPGVATIIIARPQIQAQTRGVTTFLVPYLSPGGRDNLWVHYSDYATWYREQGNTLNFGLYGQSQLTANEVLKNGGRVLGMSIKPNDAKYSHLVVGVYTKVVNPVTHPTNPGTPVRATITQPSDPENLESGAPKKGERVVDTLDNGYVLIKHKALHTDTASHMDSVENFFALGNGQVLQDGYELNKLMMSAPKGRGPYYDRFGILFQLDPTLDSTYDWRCYTMQYVELSDDGGILNIENEGPWTVALTPEARDSNGTSMFIEDVVNQNSRNFTMKFNTEAYLRIAQVLNSFKTEPVDPYEYDVITGRDRAIRTFDENDLPVPHNDIVFTDELSEGPISHAIPQTQQLKMMQQALQDLLTIEATIDGSGPSNDNTKFEKNSLLLRNVIRDAANTLTSGTSKPQTRPNQRNSAVTSAGPRHDIAYSPGTIFGKLQGIELDDAPVLQIATNGTHVWLLDPEDVSTDLAASSSNIYDVVQSRGRITPLVAAAAVQSGGSPLVYTLKHDAGDFTLRDGSDDPIALSGILQTGVMTFVWNGTPIALRVSNIGLTTFELSGQNFDASTFPVGGIASTAVRFISDTALQAASPAFVAPATGIQYGLADTVFRDSELVRLDTGLSVSGSEPYTASPSLLPMAQAYYKVAATQWDEGGSAYTPYSFVTAQRVINSVSRLFGANIPGPSASTRKPATRTSALPNFSAAGTVAIGALEGNDVIDFFIHGGDPITYYFAANVPIATRTNFNLSTWLGTGATVADYVEYLASAGLNEGLANQARSFVADVNQIVADYNRTLTDYIQIMSDAPKVADGSIGGYGVLRDRLDALYTEIDDANPADPEQVLIIANSILALAEGANTSISSVRKMSAGIKLTESQANDVFGDPTSRGYATSSAEYAAYLTSVNTLRRRIIHNYNTTMIIDAAKALIDSALLNGVLNASIVELNLSMHEYQKYTVEELVGTAGYFTQLTNTIAAITAVLEPITSSPIDVDTLDNFVQVIEAKLLDITEVANVTSGTVASSDVINWSFPVYMRGGSLGSMDHTKFSRAVRDERFQALLMQSIAGTIQPSRGISAPDEYLPMSVRNPEQTQYHFIIDANYPTPVKIELSKLAQFREDCIALLDTRFLNNINQVINYRRRDLVVNHFTSAIFTQTGETSDPETGTPLRVTSVYDLARKIPLHDVQSPRSIGDAFVGTTRGGSLLRRLNFVPETVAQRDSLYELGLNYLIPNGPNAVGYMFGTQLTSQAKYDALTEIPNVRVVQEMRRVVSRIVRGYDFIRLANSGSSLYNAVQSEVNQYLSQFVGYECSEAFATVYGSAADRVMKLTRVAITVKFYEFTERFIVTFSVGLASEMAA
jgi:hypothetical protein